MEAISAGSPQTTIKTGITVNLSETPKRTDETATVNDRVNSVQTAAEPQAGLSASQAPPPVAPATNGIEQQLRQSALQSDASRSSEETTARTNSQSAISAFQSVENIDKPSSAALTDSAGLSATPDTQGRFSAVA